MRTKSPKVKKAYQAPVCYESKVWVWKDGNGKNKAQIRKETRKRGMGSKYE